MLKVETPKDLLQQVGRPLRRSVPPDAEVAAYVLGQLPPDREHRVERGHRILEDHPDVAPRDRAQFAAAQTE